MSLLHQKSTFQSPSSYICLQRPLSSSPQSIRVNSNSISILDPNGKIIKQVFTQAKCFPSTLTNQQINQRSLVNNLDKFIQGHNLSVFFIGSTRSGKQKLFDGTRDMMPLVYYFLNYAIPQMNKKFRKLEIRLKMVLVVKEKVYDCLAENRYSIVKVQNDHWEGVMLANACNVIVDNSQDVKNQLERAIKQKNKLVLQYKQLYTSYLTVQFIHQSKQNQSQSIISKLHIFQIPSVQILGQSHSTISSKQSPTSLKSLLNFSSLLQQYSRNEQFVPYSQNSILTQLTKDIIGSNSLVDVFFNLRQDDPIGAMATLRFIKPFLALRQFSILNQSNTFGLLRKFRAEAIRNNKDGLQQQKGILQNQVVRMQTQQDYQRVMEKYVDLKQKYNTALKKRSEAQLQLIKCEQEKIQIGKALVDVQIQNTKLLQKLQNKDYQSGKKMLTVQNKLAQRQLSSQQLLQRLQSANQSLNQALQTKRDLQVQFIALKRNFIINRKQLQKLKQDNQNLSLDVINITNLNQRLKGQILNTDKSFNNNKRSVIEDMERQKTDQMKREIKQQQQTIQYLKAEVQRFRKQLLQKDLGVNKLNNFGDSKVGNDYQRLQIESQNMELLSRLKLKQRKIDQIQEKLAFYQDQNSNLQNDVRLLKIKQHNQTQQYRRKLQQLIKSPNYQSVLKQLKQNFLRKDTQSLDKINSSLRLISQQKRSLSQYKQYIRQLIGLLQQWGPKGAQIPQIKKYMNLSFGDQKEQEGLRIKCRRLEEQIRRMRDGMGSGIVKQARIQNQMDFLTKSKVGTIGNTQKLKIENNSLIEENRRLTILLKDGNKMDLNIIKKENDQLRKRIEALRNQNTQKSSISPSTLNSDQKLGFYEKHIKKIQKQRAELLSRCVVAQEQVKNLLIKIGNGKR